MSLGRNRDECGVKAVALRQAALLPVVLALLFAVPLPLLSQASQATLRVLVRAGDAPVGLLKRRAAGDVSQDQFVIGDGIGRRHSRSPECVPRNGLATCRHSAFGVARRAISPRSRRQPKAAAALGEQGQPPRREGRAFGGG